MALTVSSNLQYVGQDALSEVLKARLSDPAYTRFRFAVAFVRWSGLHLIDPELQAFATRNGTHIEGLVGIDLGGTTIEALTYLSELPSARIRVVRSGML